MNWTLVTVFAFKPTSRLCYSYGWVGAGDLVRLVIGPWCSVLAPPAPPPAPPLFTYALPITCSGKRTFLQRSDSPGGLWPARSWTGTYLKCGEGIEGVRWTNCDKSVLEHRSDRSVLHHRLVSEFYLCRISRILVMCVVRSFTSLFRDWTWDLIS